MPKRTLGIGIMVLGVAILAIAFLADRLGMGAVPNVFGWKQTLAAAAGMILLVVGGLLQRG